MRNIIVTSIISVAIVTLAGMWMRSPSTGAAPSSSPHEARVVILTDAWGYCPGPDLAPCDWIGVREHSLYALAITSLDLSAYPLESQVTLNVVASSMSPGMTACFRLVQRDASTDPDVAGVPVTGSDGCAGQSARGEPFLVESPPVTLPAMSHFYGVDFRADGPPATNSGMVLIEKVEMVVRWTESPASVGGVAQQPDLPASVVGHGRLSYGTAVLALALLALVGAGGWWVQRTRTA